MHSFISTLAGLEGALEWSLPVVCNWTLCAIVALQSTWNGFCTDARRKPTYLDICVPNNREISSGDQAGASLKQRLDFICRADVGSSAQITPFCKSPPEAPCCLVMQMSGCAVGGSLYMFCPSLTYICKPTCAYCSWWRVLPLSSNTGLFSHRVFSTCW